MFKSLQSRILLLAGFTVFITASSIFFFAQHEMEIAVTSAEERHARDLLAAILLSVEAEYQSLLFHRETTLQHRKAELKNIVNLATAHLDEEYQQYKKGDISDAEARARAIEAISHLRYDDGVGYIWINDIGQPVPRMITHPTLPELDGQLLDDPTFDTALGANKNLFVAAVDISLKHGEGFLDYLWPKPTRQGLSEEQPKISYVKLFDQWGWVLGTGVYIDDIEAETQKRLDAIIVELNKIFAKVRVAETGYMFLFNGKKEMLVHPNIVGAEFATLKNPVTGALFFDEITAVAKTPDQPLDYVWDKPGFKGQYRFPKRVFAAYFEPLDWYIGASIYTDELTMHGKQLRKRVFYLGLFFMGAAFMIAIAMSRSMSKPLLKLAQSAKQIAKTGLAAASIPISGTTETRELGQVLEQMVVSLRKAEEELRGVNWELEEFVNTVSHDLRTPLTPIIGFAQFLRDEYAHQLDVQALDCLTEIENQGYRMIAHMEDLLTLAKVGYLARPDEPVDVEIVVQQVILELKQTIKKSAVEIRQDPLPMVSVPELLLSQVFHNLISNAIHYAGSQGNPIEVGGERTDSKVQFYVMDHGHGVQEKEREGIFHVFCRGSTSKSTKGTGLGLAIVQKIAQAYGGRAWVDETSGGGCTFRVEFEDTTSTKQRDAGRGTKQNNL